FWRIKVQRGRIRELCCGARVAAAPDQFWPGHRPATLDRRTTSKEAHHINIQQLSRQSEAQHSLQPSVDDRPRFGAPRESCSLGSSIPVLFLVVLAFWLTI